uniref:Uncharacterized protein n=1 Tax=Arundo donax TaxID=35708 RepID=A0A0A9H6S4_ARUDO
MCTAYTTFPLDWRALNREIQKSARRGDPTPAGASNGHLGVQARHCIADALRRAIGD